MHPRPRAEVEPCHGEEDVHFLEAVITEVSHDASRRVSLGGRQRDSCLRCVPWRFKSGRKGGNRTGQALFKRSLQSSIRQNQLHIVMSIRPSVKPTTSDVDVIL